MAKSKTTERFTRGGDHNGTSLKTYFTVSYKALRAILGPPTNGEGYKVSTEWVVQDTVTGETFTVYDYKSTKTYDSSLPSVRAFRALPEYDWHIGGRTDPSNFVAWLREKLAQFPEPKI